MLETHRDISRVFSCILVNFMPRFFVILFFSSAAEGSLYVAGLPAMIRVKEQPNCYLTDEADFPRQFCAELGILIKKFLLFLSIYEDTAWFIITTRLTAHVEENIRDSEKPAQPILYFHQRNERGRVGQLTLRARLNEVRNPTFITKLARTIEAPLAISLSVSAPVACQRRTRWKDALRRRPPGERTQADYGHSRLRESARAPLIWRSARCPIALVRLAFTRVFFLDVCRCYWFLFEKSEHFFFLMISLLLLLFLVLVVQCYWIIWFLKSKFSYLINDC